MHTIIIPGYSAKNKDWALETQRTFEEKGLESRVYFWSHWEGGDFIPSREAQKIIAIFGGKKVNILAKSIGTFVFLEILAHSPELIEKIILCGLPVNDLSEEENKKYKELAKLDPKKIIIFQNESDPHGTFEQIRKLMSEINPEIKVVKKERSDHDYPFPEDFLAFLD